MDPCPCLQSVASPIVPTSIDVKQALEGQRKLGYCGNPIRSFTGPD
jgi:hypothetical protein